MVKTSLWIDKVEKYTPGLSVEEIKSKYSLDKVYKMASNENPLPPPVDLVNILQNKLPTIHRYPSYMKPVVQAVSGYYQMEPQQVLLGNGSSELIDKLMQAYGGVDISVLISEKSFPLYTVCAQSHRLNICKASMTEGLKVNIQEMLSLLRKNQNIRLIFISNPNNPTGSYITHLELDTLLSETKGKKVLVILDEAYWGYIRAKDFPDGLSLMQKYPHLVLLRSMSKVMGLAGLRAGVMLAHPSVTKVVKKVICPFNVNIMAVEAILYCVSNDSFKKYLSDSKELVWRSLDYFYDELKKLNLMFYPSQGNFLLFSIGKPSAFSYFLKKGLILRSINEPGLENYLRISMGLEHENKKAVELIREACSKSEGRDFSGV